MYSSFNLLLQNCVWPCKVGFYDFFEFSVPSTMGHAYKLYKQRCGRTDFLRRIALCVAYTMGRIATVVSAVGLSVALSVGLE